MIITQTTSICRLPAEEFAELAKDASSPFLRAYYQRIAEQYRLHAEGELRVIEQEMAVREVTAT